MANMDIGTLYFVHLNTKSNDGGLSRNLAFYEYYINKGAKVRNVFCRNKFRRILCAIDVLRVLFFSKNKIIFIHQGTIIYLFPMSILKYSYFFNALFKTLQHISNRNRLIVEVNDLPYEQAIDLELTVNIKDKHFEGALYTLKKCFYIFASQQMNDYVKGMFKIQDGRSEVIINGSTKLDANDTVLAYSYSWINQPQYKCVYAGSLNKGRQIEALIELFTTINQFNLILLGDWGEWLLDYPLPSNVIYLGNKEHPIAQKIVSRCDLGLIQYNAERFYYNLCFPTKISFYLTAGLPVLTTPLTELKNHFGNSECVYFVEFDKWKAFLLCVNSEFINKAKINAKKESIDYEWTSVLTSSKFLNM
jgi:glycosyltransferase involved in cell wall biosynthesis